MSIRISVSSLQGFHACPRYWLWSQTWGSKEPDLRLFTGSGVHAGLEGYYKSDRKAAMAVGAAEEWRDWSIKKIRTGLAGAWSFIGDRYENAAELVLGMVKNFVQYDAIEKPIVLRGEIVSVEDKLTLELFPGVTIVMKSDLVLRDRGKLRVIDHKTYSSTPSIDALDLDDQLTAYIYLYSTLKGETPTSAVFNVLYKSIPLPPAVLQRGGLSKSKSQSTTYVMYKQALAERELSEEGYEEILLHLKAMGWSTFFQQFETFRNDRELESFEKRLVAKTFDICRAIRSPEIWAFPNPSAFQCKDCMFATACKAENDGGDSEAVLRAKCSSEILY